MTTHRVPIEIILTMNNKLQSFLKLCLEIDADRTNHLPASLVFKILGQMKIKMPFNETTLTFLRGEAVNYAKVLQYLN